MVHLSRAWLTSRSAEHKSPEAIRRLQYVEGNGGRAAAIDVLRANREVIIFEDTTEAHETSVSGELMSESGSLSADSGYASHSEAKQLAKRTTPQWTYKALIVDLWRNLEAMKAKLDHLKRQGPEFRVGRPSYGPTLTGWDVGDLLLGHTPMEPRSIDLKPESKAWNKFIKEISSVPLLAESFHELISPLEGSQGCKHLITLPTDRDLLAVPLSVLLLTAHRFLRWEENLPSDCARLSDHTFLFGFEKSAEGCRCPHGLQCESISVLGKEPRQGVCTTRSIFDRCPYAAVIIGMPIPLWKRISQSSSSRTRPRLPVSHDRKSSPSSQEVDATSDARSDHMDSQNELGGEESDSLSDGSVYFSCPDS